MLWRLVRYGLQFPIWGDEAFVCLNLLNYSYADMAGPLECGQVAPLLFMWGELAAYQLFGGSELAVRLLPCLAGIGSVALMWRLCWRTLSPLAATFAVGLLATAYWPVAMSCTVKPYSFDLFMALALLVGTVEWLHQPDRSGWLAFLVCLCPVAIFSSYPAIFVAGAVSVALLPKVWREANWVGRSYYCLFNVVMLASFAIHFGLVARAQCDSGDSAVKAHLESYWANGFPPGHPVAFAQWFVLIHTGRMCAYPVGDADGGSTATALLALVGLAAILRGRRHWTLIALLLVPFALNFIAATLHKYPYGGCCRLSQHLAPAICMLGGLGIATLVRFIPSRQTQDRFVYGICAALAFVPALGMMRDLARPYKDFEPYRARGLLHEVFARAQAGDPVIVLNAPKEVDPVFRWMLSQYGDRVHWEGKIDPAKLDAAHQAWLIGLRTPDTPEPAVMPLHRLDAGYCRNRDLKLDEAMRLGQFCVMECDVRRWAHWNGQWTEVRCDLTAWPRHR